ncbi:cyclase [Kosmotoga arenicorallina S304]|uniref:Cyclase n=1 Tax=Kosmotoga arenicorallina S304 TaxID=1453497 RepID=A0A176K2R5_9BACT|nr:cyclase family protein [Kosmotoga arenicorallina]OAA31580.1 cyclase [Kosmotoga arenicorallina S304]
MSKFIDLSRIIKNGMAVYPGDDETILRQSRYLSKDGYNNHRLEISMHSGTHIDGPMHMTNSKKHILEFPLENFVGEGVMLDVRGQEVIEFKEEYELIIKKRSIVILHTGCDEKFGTKDYFLNNPVVSKKFAKFLVEREVKMLGLDSASPDRYPFEIHHILFSGGVLIAENLTNLDKLLGLKTFEVIALPLRIKADSSIARVIVRITE